MTDGVLFDNFQRRVGWYGAVFAKICVVFNLGRGRNQRSCRGERVVLEIVAIRYRRIDKGL